MKKLLTIFSTTMLMGVAACQHVELPVEPEGANAPEFTAKIESFDAETKTALANGNSVVWSAQDQIAIFQGTSTQEGRQEEE